MTIAVRLAPSFVHRSIRSAPVTTTASPLCSERITLAARVRYARILIHTVSRDRHDCEDWSKYPDETPTLNEHAGLFGSLEKLTGSMPRLPVSVTVPCWPVIHRRQIAGHPNHRQTEECRRRQIEKSSNHRHRANIHSAHFRPANPTKPHKRQTDTTIPLAEPCLRGELLY